MKIFGFNIFGTNNEKEDELPSFSTPVVDDGALTVAAGGSYGTVIDLDGNLSSDIALINKYRDMSLYPEIDSAITDIINEMIIFDPEKNQIVEIITDHIDELPPKIKELINEEFKTVLNLLHFNVQAHDIARRNYIDGRLYFHAIIDPTVPEIGIQELRYLDPRKIKKIREVANATTPQGSSALEGQDSVLKVVNEYYVYNERGLTSSTDSKNVYGGQTTAGVKIASDAVIHTTSGMTDASNKLVLSHLHKAIKNLNMLRSIEDASLIYRLARAPDRRIFYIDVGNLPRNKADQYLREMMLKHRNKMTYDSASGEVKDDRKHITLLEDYWFPRRADGRSTEVTTLPGGQSVGVLEEMEYFKAKLYQSLNVPYSRTNPDAAYSLGRATEISRDEVKFSKFIDRLQLRFNDLFIKILRVQLACRGIMSPDEWDMFKYKVQFRYSKDNLFEEMKTAELRDSRMTQLQIADQFVGVYYSHEWIKRNILMQNDAEIERIAQEIELEQEMIAARAAETMMKNGIDPDNPSNADPNADPNQSDGNPVGGNDKKKPPPKKGKSINKKSKDKKKK